LRLAESFETALRLADGVARVAFLDQPERAEPLFSAGYACPLCGYSLSELEPRLFSFNNPLGPVRNATDWGSSSFSIPNEWWRIRI
jgi:Excinuclease ABC subunit A